MSTKNTTEELVDKITDWLNSYVSPCDTFVNYMARQHRTLQQRFTMLCVKWLQHCGSEEYLFDDRNEASAKLGKQFNKLIPEDKKYLPYI